MDKKSHWQQKLAESRSQLESVINSLNEADWQRPVFSENQTWTVLHVIAHMVENERGMSIHIHKIRKGEETVPEGFKIDRWNAGLKDRLGEITPEELKKRMAEVRERCLKEMESLQDEEWQLTGRHPTQGIITIEQYYQTMANHELTHTNDIKRALGLS